jgi:flavodoxin
MSMKRPLRALALLPAYAAFVALAFCASPAPAQTPEDAAAQAKERSGPAPLSEHFGKTAVIVYSLTGNTLNMAEKIRQKTGGDILRIETVEIYPSGEQLIPYAKKQRDELGKPTLKTPLPDLSGYDTIFLGSPVWFHELPPAVALYLEAMDFGDRQLAPFLTCGGGPGEAMETLRKSVRNARMLEPRVITRFASRPAEDIDREIDSWLQSLRAGTPRDDAPQVPENGAPDASAAPR